jgi:hypothetical protein
LTGIFVSFNGGGPACFRHHSRINHRSYHLRHFLNSFNGILIINDFHRTIHCYII